MSTSSSSPKLTIDIRPLLEDQWTGIPIFTRRLVQSLWRHGGVELEFMADLVSVPADDVRAAIKVGTGAFLRESIYRHASIDFKPININGPLLFPSVKGLANVSEREASTVHDMSALVMPENHVEQNIAHHLDHLKDELTTDEVVFCVSEATRAALITAFPSVETKTRILYQFADWPPEFDVLDRNLPPIQFGPYVVVVGTIEPRKNLNLIIKSLSEPEIARSDLKFVIIGPKGWLVDELLASVTVQDRERLIFSGYVSEFVKYRLIKNAKFLVFPSLYEGFGIPPLEAMALGKPVLAARTSSLPEIIDDSGIFFDPFSTADFAAGFAKLSHPASLRDLRPKAIARSKTFNWQRMAEPVARWVSGL